MFDPAHPLASGFLLAASALFLVGYAVPLLIAPIAWARWFRWEVQDDHPLTVYFGRCLGGLALAIVVIGVRSAADPVEHRLVFELIAVAAALMTGVHVWGAIRRTQPWTEDAEILLYAVTAVVAIVLRSTLG